MENNSDDALRPELSAPEWTDLSELIASLAKLHKQYKSLLYGDYRSIVLTNRQLVFERAFEEERIWIAINADSQAYHAYFNGVNAGEALNLLSGEGVSLHDGYLLPPFSFFFFRV